nr:MAG: 30S ribosomal protein S6 [Acidobacteriota bacterium]
MSRRRHMSTARQYELVYITPPDTTDEALERLQEQVKAVVDRFGGTIASTEQWGRRKLAYEIAGHREGIYVLHVINGPAALNAELDRRLRVFDDVIRHMIIRIDEELAAAERAQARRKAEAAERRSRRGLPPESDEPAGDGEQPKDEESSEAASDEAVESAGGER